MYSIIKLHLRVMETSEIDFCNRTAYNIKNIRYKYTILQNLDKRYNINISDTYTKFNNTFISKFSKFDYLLSLFTVGTPYLLYLTKINNENFTLFIDKKIVNGHKLPKIIVVNYRFHESLYKGTVFEGELLKNNKNDWSFIINDILIYKTKAPNLNLITKIKLIYTILDEYYIKDENIDVCSLYIKQFFHPKDLNYMYNKLIRNIKYKVKGIIFNQVTYNNKIVFNFNNFNVSNTKFNFPRKSDSYLTSLNQEKKLLEEIEKNNCSLNIKDEEDILLDLLDNIDETEHIKNDKEYQFEIEITDKPNVYYLYCNKNKQRHKHSIARIDTLECSTMLYNYFKKKKNNYVICAYSIEYKKWIPKNMTNKSYRDDYNMIHDYVTKFN